MATNAPETTQSSVDLTGTHSQRWLIEIVFRARKQAGNPSKALNRQGVISLFEENRIVAPLFGGLS
jgi:hypothetical protein